MPPHSRRDPIGTETSEKAAAAAAGAPHSPSEAATRRVALLSSLIGWDALLGKWRLICAFC